MDPQNWLFLLPDGTETIVRVLAWESADAAPVRNELIDGRDVDAWRIGLVLAASGEVDGRPYQCLARIEGETARGT